MSDDLKARIEGLLKEHRLVLFMKGNPDFPMCGFSANAVATLRAAGAGEFFSVDVLGDPDIRRGIKEYGNWPTIPQLYADGKLIGGSDILRELHERGELAPLVAGG